MVEKRKGKIINICSMMSELGRETVSAYAAAKGGLKKQSFTKTGDTEIAEGNREGVATASSRASEAKEDFTWDE